MSWLFWQPTCQCDQVVQMLDHSSSCLLLLKKSDVIYSRHALFSSQRLHCGFISTRLLVPLFLISSLEFLVTNRADVTAAFLSHNISWDLPSLLFFKVQSHFDTLDHLAHPLLSRPDEYSMTGAE